MKLSFDPMTIEHLGFKMYSHLPNAVAELIANAYDADATSVVVTVRSGRDQSVEVSDDGHGMSAEDLAERYLRIGRNRRSQGGGYSESGARRVAGRKGLGKLALFGIGTRITIRTKRVGSDSWTEIALDWEEIKASTGGEYRPNTRLAPAPEHEHGTRILVEDLQRRTPVVGADLARSLSRLFNYVDQGFNVEVRGPGDGLVAVTRKLRYESIATETLWQVPDDVPGILAEARELRIQGEIRASEKPLAQEMRGITLYVDGRLANEPEYFGVAESSFAFSYITGFIEVDYLDDLEVDIIATDRRSISWESDEAVRLRHVLASLLREVASQRRDTRRRAKGERLRTQLNVEPEKWADSIRGPEAEPLREVLEVLVSPDSEIADDDRSAIVKGLTEIVPEYADLHWRHLHSRIQHASDSLYRDGHYFHAVIEAIKLYIADVRSMCGERDIAEYNLLQKAFSEGGLDVFLPWVSSGFSAETKRNVREGQKGLSVGVLQGFRNPLSHEQVVQLQEAGVFTYQDCLDALSILSHLRRRLDGAAVPLEEPGTPPASAG